MVSWTVEGYPMSKKPKKNPIAVKIGKAGGLARAKALTPEQRSAIARKGGLARMRGTKS